VSIVRFFIL